MTGGKVDDEDMRKGRVGVDRVWRDGRFGERLERREIRRALVHSWVFRAGGGHGHPGRRSDAERVHGCCARPPVITGHLGLLHCHSGVSGALLWHSVGGASQAEWHHQA